MEKYDVELCYRIKDLRKALFMNQTEFGSKLGIAQSYLTNIETGKRPVTDKIFKLICLQTWNGKLVNKGWLRTGEGDIFQEIPLEDEVASAVSNVLDDIGCKNPIYTLVKELLLKYEQLDSSSKKVINTYVDSVMTGYVEQKQDLEEL